MTITDQPTHTYTSTDWVQRVGEIGAELRPGVADRDRSGEISVEAFDRLRATGVTSALVPTESGGAGASHADMGQMLRELGRHDPATAVTLSMHSHLLAAQVWRHHHGIDAEKVFRKVVDDGAILVSTGASDWIGSNGSARHVDGGFRVTARKAPASGCEVGHLLVSSVRWEDAPEGPQVLHFAVPFSADGVSIERTWDTLGMRATASHTVVLDDVFVPEAAISLARPADQWHPVWNTVIGCAMPLIVAAYLGIADTAVELARDTMASSSKPERVHLLGEMINAHTTAADVTAAMFQDTDNLHFANTDELASRTLSRKTVATNAMIDTVRLALEIVGGTAYTRNSEVERLYRDIHGSLYHPLPRAAQTQFTARVALGLSPVG